MANLFGSNHDEIGSLDKNLILKTKGKVKIQYGKKFIDLLDNNGNINVKVKDFIFKVNSEDDITQNGIYIIDKNIYIKLNENLIPVAGDEVEYIQYNSDQDLTQEQIKVAQKNIGLTFSSIEEAKNKITSGLVIVEDKLYYINDGNETELLFEAKSPIKEINELGTPETSNFGLLYVNGKWKFEQFPNYEEYKAFYDNVFLDVPEYDIEESAEGDIVQKDSLLYKVIMENNQKSLERTSIFKELNKN